MTIRKILFRAKRIDTGEWVRGHYYNKIGRSGDVLHYIQWYSELPKDTKIWLQHSHRIDPNTLGQFTGLHDKNGKMIFEGDVVTLTHGGSVHTRIDCPVVFECGSFQLRRPEWPDPIAFVTYASKCAERHLIDELDEVETIIEITGTIHATPTSKN